MNASLTTTGDDLRMSLYYHDLYTDGIHPDARFPRERYRRIRERLGARTEGPRVRIREAPAATRDEIVVAHDATYVDRFLDGSMSDRERRRIGLRPWTPALIPRTQHIVGGALGALRDAVASGGVAANMAGGTHHAHHDWGSGYCVFNDLAICARLARPRYGLSRVLVVDLDVHQGDGTATVLEDDPDLHTLSVHCAQNFPFSKSTSTWDIAVEEGADDETFLAAVDQGLALGFATDPELVLYQAGVDPLAADALGRLRVSHEGLRARNQRVFDACLARQIPCVVFMGGGYSNPIDATVDAFVDLFSQAAQAHGRALHRSASSGENRSAHEGP